MWHWYFQLYLTFKCSGLSKTTHKNAGEIWYLQVGGIKDIIIQTSCLTSYFYFYMYVYLYNHLSIHTSYINGLMQERRNSSFLHWPIDMYSWLQNLSDGVDSISLFNEEFGKGCIIS